MKKLSNSLALVAALFVGIWNIAHAQDKNLTIGMLLPLTGPQAGWGQTMRLSAQLAVKESGTPVTLKVEDTQIQPSIALSAYDKLRADSRQLDALIVVGSGVSMAIAPRAERDKLLTIAIASSDDIQRNRKFIFRHMVSPKTVTETLWRYVQTRDLKKIAAISTTQDGMLAFQRSFTEQAQSRVATALDVPPSEREFATIVQKALGMGIDSIYSTLLPPQSSFMARQARQLGFKGQIFAATQVNSASELAAGGESFEGMVFVADGDAMNTAFEDRYQREYGTGPDNFAANANDCIRLLITALNSGDPLKTLEEVKDFHGALGAYSALPDHSFSIPAHLRLVKGGKVIELQRGL